MYSAIMYMYMYLKNNEAKLLRMTPAAAQVHVMTCYMLTSLVCWCLSSFQVNAATEDIVSSSREERVPAAKSLTTAATLKSRPTNRPTIRLADRTTNRRTVRPTDRLTAGRTVGGTDGPSAGSHEAMATADNRQLFNVSAQKTLFSIEQHRLTEQCK